MKIYILDVPEHAGYWIYKGYRKAWEKLGFDVEIIKIGKTLATSMLATNYMANIDFPEEYMIMYPDAMCQAEGTIEAIAKSHKTFIYTQPNAFVYPWGQHPNFACGAPNKTIHALNDLENVHLWTFGDHTANHFKWKKVHTVPLAFDSISYQPISDEKYSKYDISFVGGWADNGFNEKRKIMIEYFSEFMKSGLKCGFFVGKNLTHEQENLLLYNSKLTLNIHDAYQRILGTDTNERTFKGLGLNGTLVSDTVGQLNRIFPHLKTSIESKEVVQIAKDYLSLTEKELKNIKEENRQLVLENHCYTNRVQQLLELPVVDIQHTGIPQEKLARLPPAVLKYWENFLAHRNIGTGLVLMADAAAIFKE